MTHLVGQELADVLEPNKKALINLEGSEVIVTSNQNGSTPGALIPSFDLTSFRTYRLTVKGRNISAKKNRVFLWLGNTFLNENLLDRSEDTLDSKTETTISGIVNLTKNVDNASAGVLIGNAEVGEQYAISEFTLENVAEVLKLAPRQSVFHELDVTTLNASDIDTKRVVTVGERLGVGTLDPQYVVDIDHTGALRLPSGTTAQRPSDTVPGLFRYNTETNNLENFNKTAWKAVGGGVVSDLGDEVMLIDGTNIMEANMDLGGFQINNLATGTVSNDATNLLQVETLVSDLGDIVVLRDGTQAMTGDLNMDRNELSNTGEILLNTTDAGADPANNFVRHFIERITISSSGTWETVRSTEIPSRAMLTHKMRFIGKSRSTTNETHLAYDNVYHSEESTAQLYEQEQQLFARVLGTVTNTPTGYEFRINRRTSGGITFLDIQIKQDEARDIDWLVEGTETMARPS